MNDQDPVLLDEINRLNERLAEKDAEIKRLKSKRPGKFIPGIKRFFSSKLFGEIAVAGSVIAAVVLIFVVIGIAMGHVSTGTPTDRFYFYNNGIYQEHEYGVDRKVETCYVSVSSCLQEVRLHKKMWKEHSDLLQP